MIEGDRCLEMHTGNVWIGLDIGTILLLQSYMVSSCNTHTLQHHYSLVVEKLKLIQI